MLYHLTGAYQDENVVRFRNDKIAHTRGGLMATNGSHRHLQTSVDRLECIATILQKQWNATIVYQIYSVQKKV